MQNHHGNTTENTMRDHVRVLFRHKAIIITCVFMTTATVVFGVLMKTNIYKAQVKMLVTGEKKAQADYYVDIAFSGTRSGQIAMTQAEIVASDPVIEKATMALGLVNKPFDYEKRFCSPLKKPFVEMRAKTLESKMKEFTPEQKKSFMFRMAMEDLRRRVKVDPLRDTDIFTIQVRDFNPLGAAVSANIVSRAYVIFDLEQQVAEMKIKYGEKNQAVIQLKEAIEKMTKSLSGAPMNHTDAIGPASVKIIEQAKVPLEPEGIPKPVAVILGSLAGLFLSVLLAFAFEYMDPTFKSPAHIESFLGTRHLASLTRKPDEDDYRNFSEHLYMALKHRDCRTVVFTSALENEGVSPIVTKLGSYVAANLNKKVLLIDSNLRDPQIQSIFKLPKGDGLHEIVEGKVSFDEGVRHVRPNLDIMTASQVKGSEPIAALESKGMKEMLSLAQEKYDMVLIDTAPLGAVKDAAVVSSLLGGEGVVMVVKEGSTRRHVVRNAVEHLKDRKANLVGAVLNNRHFAIPGAIYKRV